VHENNRSDLNVWRQVTNQLQNKPTVARAQIDEKALTTLEIRLFQEMGHYSYVAQQRIESSQIPSRTHGARVAGRQFIQPLRFKEALHSQLTPLRVVPHGN